jgi:hypothetical protein
MDTGVLEEYAVSIFRNEVITMRIWPAYAGRVPRIVVTQNLGVGEEEKPCVGQ